jgi:glutaredoxin 3
MDNLVIYSRDNCPYCDMVKNLLGEHGITYSEVDVMSDDQARSFLKDQGHKTVPQIYQNGKLFVEGGFMGMKALLENTAQVA